MNITTIPTKISKTQYSHAMMVVDRNTGDHFIFWGEEKTPSILTNHLWVGRDELSLRENFEELDGAEVQCIDVTDENGNEVEIEAWTYKASQIGVNDLDLDALADGDIRCF